MSARTVKIDVRLPRALIEELTALAKLAGVSVETVMKVAMATEILRHKRAAELKTGGAT